MEQVLSKRKRMRKLFEILSCISVTITIVILICTVLNSNQYMNLSLYFNNYGAFQVSLSCTMLFSAVALFDRKEKINSLFLCGACIMISFASMFFKVIGVF